MTRRATHAECCCLCDEIESAVELRSHRNDEHGSDAVELFDDFVVGIFQKVRILRTAHFRVHERTFEVHAGNFDRTRSFAVFRNGVHHFFKRVVAERKRRRKPARHAFLDFAIHDFVEGFNRSVASVCAAGAVRVNIDKARHEHLSAGIDNFVRRGNGRVRGEDLCDFSVFDENGTAGDIDAGRDDVCVFN